MNKWHDVFGMPDKIETVQDMKAVELGNDLFGIGMVWSDYKKWRREVARNSYSGDLDRIWCRLGSKCDEHWIITSNR